MDDAPAQEPLQAHIGSDGLCCPVIEVQQRAFQRWGMLLQRMLRQTQQIWHGNVQLITNQPFEGSRIIRNALTCKYCPLRH
jgi:hypothetical protein